MLARFESGVGACSSIRSPAAPWLDDKVPDDNRPKIKLPASLEQDDRPRGTTRPCRRSRGEPQRGTRFADRGRFGDAESSGTHLKRPRDQIATGLRQIVSAAVRFMFLTKLTIRFPRPGGCGRFALQSPLTDSSGCPTSATSSSKQLPDHAR